MLPFAVMGFAAFLASALTCCIGVLPSVILAALMSLMFLLLRFRLREFPHRMLLLFALAGAVLSMSRCVFEIQTALIPVQSLEGQELAVSGQITDVVPGNGNIRYTVQASFPENDTIGTMRINLWAKGDLAVGKIGDSLSGKAYFYPSDSETMLERTAEASYRIRMRGFLREAVFIPSRFWRVETFFSYLRGEISRMIRYAVPGQAGALINALLCGDRSDLSASLERDILVTGLTHLLSISGSHLSIVVLMLRKLLDKRSLPVRTGICLFGIFFYAMLTGASYAVMRAAVMCMLLLFAELLGRSYSGVNALGFAAFVIVLAEPFSAVSVSLWYSCAASLAILLTVGRGIGYVTEKLHLQVSKNDPFLRKCGCRTISFVLGSLLASTAASLAVLPISWAVGNTISLLSPFSTLAAGIFLPFIVFGGFFTCVTAWIPFVSRIFAFFTGLISALLIEIIHWMARFPYAALPKGQLWLGPSLLGISVLLLIGFLYRRSRGTLMSAALLSVLTVSLSYLGSNILTKDLTRVIVPGETACALISQGNTHLLVGTVDSDYEAGIIADTMRDYGIRELQLALLEEWDAAILETISGEVNTKLLCTSGTIGAGLERYAETVLPLSSAEFSAGENLSAEIFALPVQTGYGISLDLDGTEMLIFYPEYAIMNIDAYPAHDLLLLPAKKAENLDGFTAQYHIVTLRTAPENLVGAPGRTVDASKRDAVFTIRDGGIRLITNS